MKEVFIDDQIIGRKRRLIVKSYKVEKNSNYSSGQKFCVQYLYKREENQWLEIIRIDNYLHQNKTGTHIHFFNKKDVKWVDLNFKEAENETIRLAEKILILLEGKNDKNTNC